MLPFASSSCLDGVSMFNVDCVVGVSPSAVVYGVTVSKDPCCTAPHINITPDASVRGFTEVTVAKKVQYVKSQFVFCLHLTIYWWVSCMINCTQHRLTSLAPSLHAQSRIYSIIISYLTWFPLIAADESWRVQRKHLLVQTRGAGHRCKPTLSVSCAWLYDYIVTNIIQVCASVKHSKKCIIQKTVIYSNVSLGVKLEAWIIKHKSV